MRARKERNISKTSLGQNFNTMRRSFFWLLLAFIALSVVVNIAVADGSDDGSDDEADMPPAAGGQAAEEGGDAQVEEDEDEGMPPLKLSFCSPDPTWQRLALKHLIFFVSR
jgi:hypothetical protein